jgi:hypothetical protein
MWTFEIVFANLHLPTRLSDLCKSRSVRADSFSERDWQMWLLSHSYHESFAFRNQICEFRDVELA